MLKIGQQIGRYRVLSTIGAGGMGEVYLADDKELERTVAIKILPDDLAANKDRVQRFVQEAKATSALNHPNILTIHEIGSVHGKHFIVSEFIKGKTLRDKLQTESLDLSETIDIAIQIGLALQAAHEAKIIHRDIKPENVMIRDDGFVKVLDFGLAKLTEQQRPLLGTEAPTKAKVRTQSGVILGTVAYISPEQARGKSVDERTDVWSLGVLLYEMLAKRKPFGGETTTDVLAAILTKDPVSPSALNPDVPIELERIVIKSLRKDREERYQTVKDLLIDLKDYKQELDFRRKLEKTAEPNQASTAAHKLSDSRPNAIHTTSNAEYVVSEIRQHKRGAAIALLLVALSITGFGYWYYGGGPSDSKQIESIAVMPFVNEAGDSEIDYLADGLTESLISSLSQLPNLSVKARASVFRYKGKEINLQDLSNDLHIQAILLGRIVQRGDALTLNLELVEISNETVIWSEQYNRKQIDIVMLQSEIARDVSNKLRLRLSNTEEQRVTKSFTKNAEAYKHYLQGRYHWNKRTEEGVRRSIEYFDQAIEIDPKYALAHAGLADAYIVLPVYSNTPSKESHTKAREAALKALQIDGTLAEAHASLAAVKQLYEWDFSGAEVEYRRAIELNPSYSTAYLWYAWFLSSLGRHSEAIIEIKKAQEVDPLSLIVNSAIGNIYNAARQPDEAIGQLRKTIVMDKNFARARSYLADAYIEKGMYEDAIEEYKNAEILSGKYDAENADKRAQSLKDALQRGGVKGYWRRNLELTKENANQGYMSPAKLAAAYARAEDIDQALKLLESAFIERDQYLFYNLKIDPSFDEIRRDPRYHDLVKRVGLP